MAIDTLIASTATKKNLKNNIWINKLISWQKWLMLPESMKHNENSNFYHILKLCQKKVGPMFVTMHNIHAPQMRLIPILQQHKRHKTHHVFQDLLSSVLCNYQYWTMWGACLQMFKMYMHCWTTGFWQLQHFTCVYHGLLPSTVVWITCYQKRHYSWHYNHDWNTLL